MKRRLGAATTVVALAVMLTAAPADAGRNLICIGVEPAAILTCVPSPIPDPLLPMLPPLPAEQVIDLSSLVGLVDGI